MRPHPDKTVLRLMLILCLLAVAVGTSANDRAARYHWLISRAVLYGVERMASGTDLELIPQGAGWPSVCAESPGYVLATLEQNADVDRGQRVLAAILAGQDTAPASATVGQFPWHIGADSHPSLEATYFAAPVLSQIYLKHSDKLSPELSDKLRGSLDLAFTSIARNAPPSPDEVTGLLRAAALAMLGRALGGEREVLDSVAHVAEWLSRVMKDGVGGGYSHSLDAYRLAALKWIWQAASAQQRPGALEDALALMYQDLAYRVQPDSGAVGGALLFAERGDYVRGGEYSPYLVYTDLGGSRPVAVTPFAMFFVAPDYQPQQDLLAAAAGAMPYQVSTAALAQAYVPRTDTYMHRLFSLGTMTGQPSATSIPLFMTFAERGSRPTAYFFTRPQASHITSIQMGNVSVITVDFDFIGRGERRTALLQGILGPRSRVGQVVLGSGEWNGLSAAVPEMGIIALERSGCYVGIRILRAGPAESQGVVSGPKPGTLAWSDEGDSGELQLTVYARKQGYDLRAREHNLRVGVAVEVVPASDFESLSAFATNFARVRLRQSVERVKEALPEPSDPFEAVLTEHDPKGKSDLEYKHSLLHTIEYQSQELTLEVQEDMLSGEVIYRLANGEPMVVGGPWQVGERVLEWGAPGPASFLTTTP